jgi:hypothetical protein
MLSQGVLSVFETLHLNLGERRDGGELSNECFVGEDAYLEFLCVEDEGANAVTTARGVDVIRDDTEPLDERNVVAEAVFLYEGGDVEEAAVDDDGDSGNEEATVDAFTKRGQHP